MRSGSRLSVSYPSAPPAKSASSTPPTSSPMTSSTDPLRRQSARLSWHWCLALPGIRPRRAVATLLAGVWHPRLAGNTKRLVCPLGFPTQQHRTVGLVKFESVEVREHAADVVTGHLETTYVVAFEPE